MTEDSDSKESIDENRSEQYPGTGFSEPLIVGSDEEQLGPEPIPDERLPLEHHRKDEEPLPADLIKPESSDRSR